jgi:hypothetical protein
MAERKVIKKYSVETGMDETGQIYIRRKNDGYQAIELLGILEWSRAEILAILQQGPEDNVKIERQSTAPRIDPLPPDQELPL